MPTDIAVSLVEGNVPGLISNVNSNAINKFKRKISGEGALQEGKRSTFLISNEDMNDAIKIIKSLENVCLLIDRSYRNSKR